MFKAWLFVLFVLSSTVHADDWQRAVQNNQLDAIRRQMPRVDDIDRATQTGKTALMAAAAKGAAGLAKALIDRGADANARNRAQGTPLLYAAHSGDIDTLYLLLAQGAAVNQRSVNGWSALMMAAAKNHPQLISPLCEHGADVNLPDVYGWTPLMRAAYEGYDGVVEQLLAQPDTNVERINDHGQTALHLAVIQGHRGIARALLGKGARQAADFAGHTPRSIAATLGRDDLLALLRRAQH